MARVVLSLLHLILCVLFIAGTATFASATFVKDSCNTTRYPKDCITFLEAHATNIEQDPLKLAKEALSENLAKAQDLKYSMSHMAMLRGLRANEHAALKECLDQLDDGVDDLRKSIRELDVLGSEVGQDFVFRMSNVKTWVSSVLTNYEACIDGFGHLALNGKTKGLIGLKLEELERAISNALVLINHVPLKG